MTRSRLNKFISETYGSVADRPWPGHPTYAVYRHENSRKWFAVIMDIPKSKLGIDGNETVSVVNLKCDPYLSGDLRNGKNIFPAYHMNKEHWITVLLDGSVNAELMQTLLQMSFDLTYKKK